MKSLVEVSTGGVLRLDVTNLVENKEGNVYIDKRELISFLKDTYFPFDIELEGLLINSDITGWVSPDTTYNFESTDYNDHECGEGCLNKLSFECGSISDTEFCFAAGQLAADPFRNDPYGLITILQANISDALPEEAFNDMSPNEYHCTSVDFRVSKLYFKELRLAVINSIHEHLKIYYWCDEYTERGFYCSHVLEEDMV